MQHKIEIFGMCFSFHLLSRATILWSLLNFTTSLLNYFHYLLITFKVIFYKPIIF